MEANNCDEFTHLNKIVNGQFELDGSHLSSCSNSIVFIKSGLTTLKGMPSNIYKAILPHNKLTSFEYSPNTVEAVFDVSYNQITSLKGCPKTIGGNLFVGYNLLTHLDEENIYADHTLGLNNNKLSSLHNINKCVPRTSILTIGGNPITSSILGLFLIEHLQLVQSSFPTELDKYVNDWLNLNWSEPLSKRTKMLYKIAHDIIPHSTREMVQL